MVLVFSVVIFLYSLIFDVKILDNTTVCGISLGMFFICLSFYASRDIKSMSDDMSVYIGITHKINLSSAVLLLIGVLLIVASAINYCFF